MTYQDIQTGDQASLELTVTTETVEQYAHLIGDTNPVHLDDEYAANSFFKKRVAHGMLGAGLISAVLGTRLPGPGAIYLSQELEFKRPIGLGDTIRAKVEVLEKHDKHRKLTLRTWVENQDGSLVMDGKALVLVRP